MRSVRDMERKAARIAAMTPEEKAEHDRALAEWRNELGLSDERAAIASQHGGGDA